ncbi:MAG: hypothetical protein JNK23_22995 [Opitutaceae bacterium]|nr:hypothetical protein [Opitutaceae bacterium]
MMLADIIRRFTALALFAMVLTSVGAAESPRDAAKAAAADSRKAAQEQINAERRKMVSDYEALAKQLKDATEAQRKEIIAKLEEQKKNFQETMDALHKAMREDDRKRRQNAVSGPGKR